MISHRQTRRPCGENDPLERYRARITELKRAVDRLAARERWIAASRMAALAAGLVLLVALIAGLPSSPYVLLLPATALIALAFWHEACARRRVRLERRIVFCRRGATRIETGLDPEGVTGEWLAPPDHPCAEDLDLFGPRSLFARLSHARTHAGQAALASWLLEPSEVPALRERQVAVAELSALTELHEELAAIPGGDARRAEGGDFSGFGSRAAVSGLPPAARLAVLLGNLAAAAVACGWALGWVPLTSFAWPLLLQTLIGLTLRRRVRAVLELAESRLPDLRVLGGLLVHFEGRSFDAPLLERLRRAVESDGLRPSEVVRRLERLITLLDARRNQIFAPMAMLLMWSTHLAFAVDRWRRRHGKAAAGWLDAVAQFEALISLAIFARERPDAAFPELIDGGAACFETEGLVHPLLPRSRAVPNDLRLGRSARIVIVSGSNMSGKSTLLRAVGANVLLARAGAPVCASRMRLNTLSIAASIRVNDSLQFGASRFYAEVSRLKLAFDLLEKGLPLLVLLDEILAGTNSHDRRIGARRLIQRLAERGAIGLVTTHDLALTELEPPLSTLAINMHFADRLEGGELRFDYRLTPGVVRRSNALDLMRSVGLDI